MRESRVEAVQLVGNFRVGLARTNLLALAPPIAVVLAILDPFAKVLINIVKAPWVGR